MKLYLKGYANHTNSNIDIKKILKTKYAYDTRRQDEFIHLAVYGAYLLKENIDINGTEELYLTSGVGDVAIVQKTNTQVYEMKADIKIFDFINLLGNTASYYVAKALNLKGKNIFQISNNFTYIHTLISAYASMFVSKKDVIIGCIDVGGYDDVLKRVMGVDKDTKIGSGAIYQKLSLNPKDAKAEIQIDANLYSLCDIKEELLYNKQLKKTFRCDDNRKDVFENIIAYEINKAVKERKDMNFLECFDDKYKIIKLKSLT